MTASDIDDSRWNSMTYDQRADVLGEDNPWRVTLPRNLTVVSTVGLLLLSKTLDRDTTFGMWLLRAVVNEIARRSKGAEECEAGSLVLPLHEWSEADVAEALMYSTAMTYGEKDISLGGLWDVLCKAFVKEACCRLRGVRP